MDARKIVQECREETQANTKKVVDIEKEMQHYQDEIRRLETQVKDEEQATRAVFSKANTNTS